MKHDLDQARLLHLTQPSEWRDWLLKHYQSEQEVWLVYYKQHTGKPRIQYNDAVEEALCFGWIDSIVRSIDQDRFAQRFSVRRARTPYSQANRERLRELVKQRKVVAEVLATLGTTLEERFEIAPDILEAIRANQEAWENFQRLSPSYIRIRIAFIEGARRRPQEFKKRLRHFIDLTAQNKNFGFGGIEKYY
ncbi:MAG TPA: YdeI/OmpD-associated family protein [Anaerolineales bacterium]|nr:YdeI/OmpD-associated family protein [Anaerolineales bacterium]